MPSILINGGKGAPGGKRRNAGRHMAWFKEKMASIARKPAAIEFLESCIDGGNVDRIVVDGKSVSAPPTAQVRLAAWCEARDTGYGKPASEVKHVGLEGINILAFIQQAEDERGLSKTE